MDFPTARTQINDILDQLEATYDPPPPPPPPPPPDIPTANLVLDVDAATDLDAVGNPCQPGDRVASQASSGASQPDVSRQPVHEVDEHGKYMQSSVAESRTLDLASLLTVPQPLTIYLVVSRGPGGGTASQNLLHGPNSSLKFKHNSGAIDLRINTPTENTFGEQVEHGNVNLYSLVIDGANTNARQNAGRRLCGWDATADQTLTDVFEVLSIGGKQDIGYAHDGRYYRALVYSVAHDEATRASTETALGQLYKLVSIPPAGADPAAILPQIYDDDVTLRDWLATLSESDLDVPATAITYSPSGATVRDLYGTYQAFGSTGPRTPRNDLLRHPSTAFLLNDGAGEGIEGDGLNARILNSPGSGKKGIMLEAAEFCQLFGEAGFSNPYYHHEGVANRLCSQAIAAMMQLRYLTQWGFYGSYPEAVGMSCMQAMAAWEAGKDFATGMTPESRAAFYRTVHAILKEWDAREGPKTVNTNMDVKSWVALAHLSKGAVGEGLFAIAEDARVWAKRWMLGNENHEVWQAEGWRNHVLFHAAGYVGEKQMPETSYFGISIYYATKAALIVRGVTGWEWLVEVVDRMARFSAYQTFQDPNGSFMGPGGYCIRGGAPTCEWQSSSVGGSYAVAALSDHGIAIFQKRFHNPGLELTKLTDPTLSEVESRITSVLASDYSDWSTMPPTYNSYTSGGEWQWALRVSTVAAYCDPTDYDYISGLIATADDKLQLPHLREDYSEIFGPNQHDMPEFWSVEENGHHYFVEGFTRDPTVGTGYASWRGGGSLQTFGSRDAGTVINSASQSHSAPSSEWANVAQWVTHHLWFEMDDDTKCSSAQRDSRISQYEWTNGADGTTVMCATNTPDREIDTYSGEVTYARLFHRLPGVLQITTKLTTDGQDQIKTLWESIPIFIKKNVAEYPSTTIEYSTDGVTWATLGETIQGGITHVRLGKDYGTGPQYVYIVPDCPAKMKLGTPWLVSYQVKGNYVQLMIDLHPNSGVAQAIDEARVTYSLSTGA